MIIGLAVMMKLVAQIILLLVVSSGVFYWLYQKQNFRDIFELEDE